MSTPPDDRPDLNTDDVRNLKDALAALPPSLPGFEFRDLLGSGGFGQVFEAVPTTPPDSPPIAIKVLPTPFAPADQEAFQNEIRVLRSFDSTTVVPLFDMQFAVDRRPCLLMELAKGGDLKKRLAGNPLSDPGQAARLVERLAGAVQAANDRRIFHRDLKPSNVLLSDDSIDWVEKARLGDFGLALNFDSPASRRFAVSKGGTDAYMAPEVADGSLTLEGADEQSQTLVERFRQVDVFGLGAILYECLTGRAPWKDDTIAPPRELNRHVPAKLEKICLKALKRERKDRYATASDLANDLRAFLKHQPTTGVPTGRRERWRLWYRRKFWLVNAFFFLALSVVFLGLGLIVSSWLASEFYWQKGIAEANARAEREARQREQFERRKADVKEYAGLLKEADLALRYNNSELALRKLETCDKRLCGWEWDHLHRQCGDDRLTIELPGEPTAVALDSKTGRLAIAFKGGKIEYGHFDGVRFQVTKSFQVHKDRDIRQLAFLSKGDKLLAAGVSRYLSVARGTITLWDLNKGDAQGELIADDFHILNWGGKPYNEDLTPALSRFAISANSRYLAYSAEPLTAKVYDLQQQRLVQVFPRHDMAVLSVALSPDGELLATAGGFGNAGYVRLWNWKNARPIASKETEGPVRAIQFLDEEHLVAVVKDGQRTYFRAQDTLTIQDNGPVLDEVHAFAWHPGEKRFFLAGKMKEGEVVIRSASEPLKGHRKPITGLAFSKDGSRIISVAPDGLKVWAATPTPRDSPKLPDMKATVSLSSPDGKIRATRSDDAKTVGVKVKSEKMGNQSRTLSHEARKVLGMAFRGERLFVWYQKQMAELADPVVIYDGVSGLPLFQIQAGKGQQGKSGTP